MKSLPAKLAVLSLLPLMSSALPTAANAYTWYSWYGWDNAKECIAYYDEHPVKDKNLTSSDMCRSIIDSEAEAYRKKQEAYNHIILECEAKSATLVQAGACVRLATGE